MDLFQSVYFSTQPPRQTIWKYLYDFSRQNEIKLSKINQTSLLILRRKGSPHLNSLVLVSIQKDVGHYTRRGVKNWQLLMNSECWAQYFIQVQYFISIQLLFKYQNMGLFDFLRQGVEKDLISLAFLITTIYHNSCSLQSAQCLTKSYNECVGVSYNQVCLDEYPKEDKCNFNGRLVPSQMGTRFPNNFDMNSLTNQQKLFICSIDEMKNDFLKVKNKYTNRISRVYFGTYFGFFAGFPATQHINNNGVCRDSYDPTERLWYLQAATGPKNIVFVIDLTTSMVELEKVKLAVKKIIKSLSFNDFVAVVIMKSTSSILIYNELNRATQQVKQALSNSITRLENDPAATSVNYELAFDVVRTLFSRAPVDIYGASCQFSSNVVIFMTATPPTEGLTTSDALIAKIDEWNQVYKFKLFSYAFTENEDFSVLKNLSCRYEGHFYKETNTSSVTTLTTDLRAYERFLAGTVNIDSVVWSEPYNDRRTGERMVTVSFPLYTYNNRFRQKLGVAAIDIKTKVLEKDTITEEEAMKLLLICPAKPSFADKCILQKIRERQAEDSKCNIGNCSYQDKEKCQYNVLPSMIFESPDNHRKGAQEECCIIVESNYLGLISMIPFIVVGFFLFIGLKIRQRSSNSGDLRGRDDKVGKESQMSSEVTEHSQRPLVQQNNHQQSTSLNNEIGRFPAPLPVVNEQPRLSSISRRSLQIRRNMKGYQRLR